MGDWCVVDLVEPEGGGVRRRAASHADVRLARRARELPTVFPFGLGHRMNLPTWPLRGGREATVVLAEEMRLFDHLPVNLSEQLRTLGADAFVVAPLASKGRPLGVLTVVSATAGRYEREDVSLVEELAFRFGLALDNAWLYDEARTANRLKDEFLATVSHELRTPLNAMLGWIRLLRTGALGPDMTARALEIIERNTVAQTVLINDLLDVSRVVVRQAASGARRGRPRRGGPGRRRRRATRRRRPRREHRDGARGHARRSCAAMRTGSARWSGTCCRTR